ncbi:hypothetical protein [Candidatus Caldatribacterium sp.]|uniref:hypothetical protein n=1 Tax=Candidatus Caldatribacterium sp. TaxID=2282143 RepID=UPI0038477972|nr:hypothetical protein [Candidatus Caldatribacterium sp.]
MKHLEEVENVIERKGDGCDATAVRLTDSELQWVTPRLYERYQLLVGRLATLRRKLRDHAFDFVRINAEALDDELLRQPSYVYYVGELYAECKGLQASFELLLEEVEAKLTLMYRTLLEQERPRVTEGTIQAHVVSHPFYSDIRERLVLVGYVLTRLQAVREALSNKKEMLITYALNVRSARELEGFLVKGKREEDGND